MPDSEDSWRPRRITAFLGLGLCLYAALFAWSDATLRVHGDRNPFYRVSQAPGHMDWIVLGASHAMPLGFAGVAESLHEATGETVLALAMTGGGPFPMRVIAERYFADHSADGVLIVLDDFGFRDPRWNASRLGDSDVLPKIPADSETLRVLLRAIPRGLSWQTVAAQATGFARINDRTRFQPDRWDAEARFDTSPRPSDAADKARIAYLYPGAVDGEALMRGLADLDATIGLARQNGAGVAVVLPPLPDRFRALLPDGAEVGPALRLHLRDRDVPLHDFSAAIPEPKFYFDSDHLNRAGVARWLDEGLAAVLRGQDAATR